MKKYFVILCVSLFFVATARSQSIKTVSFPAGKTKMVYKGTITGHRYVDYIVNVHTTQYLSAKVTGGKSGMVIFEPDGETMADAAGITDLTTKIEVSGNYKIRVLLSHNHTRRKSVSSNYVLMVEVADLK